MAGLDPATQPPSLKLRRPELDSEPAEACCVGEWLRVCAAARRGQRRKLIHDSSESQARTDVRALGGRVALRLPGHDDRGDGAFRVPVCVSSLQTQTPSHKSCERRFLNRTPVAKADYDSISRPSAPSASSHRTAGCARTPSPAPRPTPRTKCGNRATTRTPRRAPPRRLRPPEARPRTSRRCRSSVLTARPSRSCPRMTDRHRTHLPASGISAPSPSSASRRRGRAVAGNRPRASE